MYQYACLGVFGLIFVFGVLVGIFSGNKGFAGFSVSVWAVILVLGLQGTFTLSGHAHDARRVIIPTRTLFPIYEFTPNNSSDPLNSKNLSMFSIMGSLMVLL